MLIRPALRRKDSVARILNEHINFWSQEKGANYEELIGTLSKGGDWVQVAALGWVYASIQPNQVRGYLAFVDGLINISFIYDAQRAIHKCLEVFGSHPLLIKRLCSLHMRTKKWEEVLKLAQQHPENDYVVRAGIDSALILKKFNEAKEILVRTSIDGQQERVANAHRAWCADLSEYADRYSQSSTVDALEVTLANGDFKNFNTACWKAYDDNTLNAEALRFATQAVKGEFEYYPRVSFFRDLAVQNYPDDDDFLLARSTTLIFENRLDEAYICLCEMSKQAFESDKVRWRTEHLRRILHEALESDRTDNRHALGSSWVERVALANLTTRKGNESGRVGLISSLQKNPNGDCVALDYLMSALPTPFNISRGKPRVALCISGQMRGFSLAWPSIKSAFVDEHNADVFVHTWDQESFTPPLFRRLSRFIGTDLVKLLPLELQQTLAFSNRFPETAKKLQEPIRRPISADEIRDIVRSRHVVVENEDELAKAGVFPKEIWHRGNANQAKMFYKIFQCDRLREQQERTSGDIYDVVIRIRPDFSLKIEGLGAYFRMVREDNSKIFVSYVNPDGCGDQFAIGSSAAMSAYSSVWKYLAMKKTFAFFPGFRGSIGEELLGEHFMVSGLHPQLIPPSNAELVNDLVINIVDLRAELEKDIGSTPPDDLKGFVSGIHKHYQKTSLGRGKTADPLYSAW